MPCNRGADGYQKQRVTFTPILAALGFGGTREGASAFGLVAEKRREHTLLNQYMSEPPSARQ